MKKVFGFVLLGLLFLLTGCTSSYGSYSTFMSISSQTDNSFSME